MMIQSVDYDYVRAHTAIRPPFCDVIACLADAIGWVMVESPLRVRYYCGHHMGMRLCL